MNYLLNGGHDGGDDEHDCQGDHDPVREIVHPKEEAEISDRDEDEGLEKGVGHMVLHPPPEHHLDLRGREGVLFLNLKVLQLNLVLHQVTLP